MTEPCFFEIRHVENKAGPNPQAGWIIFAVEQGDRGEAYVDHDWFKGCIYIPAFPPPLWGFFPTYHAAALALMSIGWGDRIRDRAGGR